MKSRSMRTVLTLAAAMAASSFLAPLSPSAFPAEKTARPARPAKPLTSAERLQKVLDYFERYASNAMADWRVPGMAIAIVRGDEVIYEKAFGVKELGKDDPVTTDTIFQIGSASKAFTAALVATLVDENRLDWNDKVTAYLSGFEMYDPWVTREFTIVDLMAQRSGMPPHAADGLIMTGSDRKRVINAIRYVKPATSFRSAYAYQNNLWLVAAAIVENLTGKSWEENIRERIFRPLGMYASSCDKESFVRAYNVSALHHDVNGTIVVLPMDWQNIDWVYTYGPAGGINSNVKDIAKWLRMQGADGTFNGRQVILPSSAKFMRAPETPIASDKGPAQYYCLGWVHREANPRPITWHNGGTSGSKTMIAFVPQTGTTPSLGIVVLSNLVETKLPEALAFRFFDIYYGNPARDWSKEALAAAKKDAEKAAAGQPKEPPEPAPAMPLERYAGNYTNEIYGTVAVAKAGSGLALTIGPKKLRLDLRHWDGNKFRASWNYYGVREDAGFVTFISNDEGAVSAMTVDTFNEDGCGRFRRAAPQGAERDRLIITDKAVVRERIAGPQRASVAAFAPMGVFERIFNDALAVNGVKQISYEELMKLRSSGDAFVLVDVLSKDDYGTGHIPGAISLPSKTINLYSAINNIPAGSNVVVYCLDFNCPYSTEAARKLTSYGYKVLDYKGGTDEWQQKGNPLQR